MCLSLGCAPTVAAGRARPSEKEVPHLARLLSATNPAILSTLPGCRGLPKRLPCPISKVRLPRATPRASSPPLRKMWPLAGHPSRSRPPSCREAPSRSEPTSPREHSSHIPPSVAPRCHVLAHGMPTSDGRNCSRYREHGARRANFGFRSSLPP